MGELQYEPLTPLFATVHLMGQRTAEAKDVMVNATGHIFHEATHWNVPKKTDGRDGFTC